MFAVDAHNYSAFRPVSDLQTETSVHLKTTVDFSDVLHPSVSSRSSFASYSVFCSATASVGSSWNCWMDSMHLEAKTQLRLPFCRYNIPADMLPDDPLGSIFPV